jgi:MFS family permease
MAFIFGVFRAFEANLLLYAHFESRTKTRARIHAGAVPRFPMHLNQPMNAIERRAVSGLGLIFALRLLGLFLILPVFAVYAETLDGYTPFLAGVALGVYGLTQGLLQLPFGLASDRFGRKPVIAFGLAMFAAGSVLAALSTTLTGVIVGRALQGAGAIAAAVIALTADLTREEQRTKAMAVIGITIGASFVASLMLGPVLNRWFGVPGIFWLTAVLAVGGLAVLAFWVPAPVSGVTPPARLPTVRQFGALLKDARLLRFDLGIFFLHAGLTALFAVVPLALVRHAGLAISDHWIVYLPVMLASALVMLPLILMAERRHRVREVFIGAVSLLVLSQLGLYFGFGSLAGLCAGLFIFFVGFNVLESQLPSLISRAAPPSAKGMAIGVYTTFEFLGAFAGGALGGWLHGRFGVDAVFLLTTVLFGLWLWLAFTMPPVEYFATHTLRVGRRVETEARQLARELAAVRGVIEATVMADEGLAYLKVDPRHLDRHALQRFAHS